MQLTDSAVPAHHAVSSHAILFICLFHLGAVVKHNPRMLMFAICIYAHLLLLFWDCCSSAEIQKYACILCFVKLQHLELLLYIENSDQRNMLFTDHIYICKSNEMVKGRHDMYVFTQSNCEKTFEK